MPHVARPADPSSEYVERSIIDPLVLRSARTSRFFDMYLIALRITGPRSRADYLEARCTRHADHAGPLFETHEEDLANFHLGALEATRVGHRRFDASFIDGDEEGEAYNLYRAKRMLGAKVAAAGRRRRSSRPQTRGETA